MRVRIVIAGERKGVLAEADRSINGPDSSQDDTMLGGIW